MSQYRRTGRYGSFNQHRHGVRGGAGGGAAYPPVSSTSNPSLSSNTSFNKYNNAQGGKPRVNAVIADSDSHQQQPLHGASDVSVCRVPKKIEEGHRYAAQERYAQATRLASTAPGMAGSTRRGQPMDFAPRRSMLSSRGSRVGSFRPMNKQVRGYGLQDVRVDERHSFEKLVQQVKEVNIDNVVTLNGVVTYIFEKALMEPTSCEMYAKFCQHLASELPDLSVGKDKITFKRLLLNKCQEEFERGEREEEEEANATKEEGEVKLSAKKREEKRLKALRRKLGNITFIGELYNNRMLTERIMHECIKKLLGDYQNPDEENIASLCVLMITIGEMIDHAKAKEHVDAYFDRMEKLSSDMKLSSRLRSMLKDLIDVRKNKWRQKGKVEGAKKTEEVHRAAAQEQHAQATKHGHTPNLEGSTRTGQPMYFAPRGRSMLSSQGSWIRGFRPMNIQVRGYGLQDVRVDERHSCMNRT